MRIMGIDSEEVEMCSKPMEEAMAATCCSWSAQAERQPTRIEETDTPVRVSPEYVKA